MMAHAHSYTCFARSALLIKKKKALTTAKILDFTVHENTAMAIVEPMKIYPDIALNPPAMCCPPRVLQNSRSGGKDMLTRGREIVRGKLLTRKGNSSKVRVL